MTDKFATGTFDTVALRDPGRVVLTITPDGSKLRNGVPLAKLSREELIAVIDDLVALMR